MQQITFDEDCEITERYEEFYNQMDYEKIIFDLSSSEVRITLLRYFGFKPKEIVAILHLHNMQSYYDLNHKMKKKQRIKLKLENSEV